MRRPSASPAGDFSKSPVSGTPPLGPADASTSSTKPPPEPSAESFVASPFKKQRASLPGFDDKVRKSLGQILAGSQGSESNTPALETKMEEDEEL